MAATQSLSREIGIKPACHAFGIVRSGFYRVQGPAKKSAPHQPVDSEQWQLRIFISVDDTHGVRTREFSSEFLYATEQETDIHGIAFGQCLIDGKVEGQSVVDMKTEDRRATPRLRHA